MKEHSLREAEIACYGNLSLFLIATNTLWILYGLSSTATDIDVIPRNI